MTINYLKWDSEFFGIKIGKIEITNEAGFDPVDFRQQASLEGYELVYLLKYGLLLTGKALQVANIELIDIQLTMSIKFNQEDCKTLPYNFRTELSQHELKDCYKIAEATSVVSRFYNEGIIGSIKTKKLYRKWIDNTLNRSFADGMFLVKVENTVAGIHVIKTDKKNKIGHCSIIGISENFRGQGIGRILWTQALSYWANEHNINFCKVPFSLFNTDSFSFHLKMGFNKIEEIKYIYHYTTDALRI